MTLVVFDLCDTLYAANTTQGFLRQLSAGEPPVARALSRWTNRRHPAFWVGALSHRLGRDLARERLVASLAGIKRSSIDEAAKAYAAGPLQQQVNPAMHEALAYHRSACERIVILSNSLQPVVSAVAERLGTEGMGSTLTFADDVCTGRLERDLTGRKSEVAADLRGRGERLIVYTDNRSDRDLIAMADEAHIILPGGRPRDRWAGEEHRYVEL